MKKQKIANNIDCHVPVYNTIDGTRLEGEDAPTVQELDWLDAHPDYAVEVDSLLLFYLDKFWCLFLKFCLDTCNLYCVCGK